MPSPRPFRNGTDRSKSFNGRAMVAAAEELRRPRTVPDLRAAIGGGGGSVAGEAKGKKMTKVLVKVTVQGSVGAVQVLMSPESTVKELIMGVVKQYVKDGRRPLILGPDVDDFRLHYSQFSLECLDMEDKLALLGSRNFFMCKRQKAAAVDVVDSGVCGGVTTSSCSKQAEKTTKLGSPCPWLKFMSFMF